MQRPPRGTILRERDGNGSAAIPWSKGLRLHGAFMVKGLLSFHFRNEHPHLLNPPSIWTHS